MVMKSVYFETAVLKSAAVKMPFIKKAEDRNRWSSICLQDLVFLRHSRRDAILQ